MRAMIGTALVVVSLSALGIAACSNDGGDAVSSMSEAASGMTEAVRDKDLATARDFHQRLTPLFEALFVEPNPMPLKGALDEVWGPVGDPRLPLIPAQPETVQAVLNTLEAAQAA